MKLPSPRHPQFPTIIIRRDGSRVVAERSDADRG